jgi:hypothetical protein
MKVAIFLVGILVVATVQGRPSADLESFGIIRGNPDKVEIIGTEREEHVSISPTF